jgi:hypothetical protein
MIASIIAVPGQLAYLSIPTNELRKFCDGMFPAFAKCSNADFVSGYYHRYKGGHDLFIDVGGTFKHDGITEAFRHLGHIVCTDFPTKAGIPIPLFSQNGLGRTLEGLGISKGWLNVNICDTGIGILAIAEGSNDLAAAVAGQLHMSVEAFFDTFTEGSIELALGMYFQNPFLLWGGVENLLAGCAATWNSCTYYVNPLEFLGGSFLSAVVGFTLSHYLLGNTSDRSFVDAARSGLIGGMFVVSPLFAYSALLGFAAYEYGRALANKHNQTLSPFYSVSKEAFDQFLSCIGDADKEFREAYERCNFIQLEVEPQTLNSTPALFPVEFNKILDTLFRNIFDDIQPTPLPSSIPLLNDEKMILESTTTTFDVKLDIFNEKS